MVPDNILNSRITKENRRRINIKHMKNHTNQQTRKLLINESIQYKSKLID